MKSACVATLVILVTPTTIGRAQSIEEKAQICSACHGENGIPQDNATPVIAGQHQGYLYLQLRDYKLGTRANDVMVPIAQALERDEMMALAEYFSKQRWPSLRQPAANAEETAVALRANAAVGCTGCHLGEYQGDGTQPRIAGQSKEYMAQTMLDSIEGINQDEVATKILALQTSLQASYQTTSMLYQTTLTKYLPIG